MLRPGGRLHLELPNFAACVGMLGEHPDPQGHDLGMIGIYGYPPAIEAEGEFQIHKWGWTPDTLAAEMRAVGFDAVESVPVTQTWRQRSSARCMVCKF